MAPYARIEVIALTLGGVLLAGLTAALAGPLWALLPAAAALALLSFYRDPPRDCPQDARQILAPADGRIVAVEQTGPAGEVRIMIFLSVFNVHVNRSPCAARVAAVDHRPGKFLNALNPAADGENEANTLTLTPQPPLPGPLRVRQIAGLLARRIVCVAKPGDELAAGQRYGMIKLGSRTETTLPAADWEICVRPGDRVKGGLSVLARLRQAPSPPSAPAP